TLITV
ncbi:hsp70 family protein, partial [Vibrio harveyi]